MYKVVFGEMGWEKKKMMNSRVSDQSASFHLTVQQIFNEHTPHARHCAKCWVFSDDYNGQVLNTCGFYHIISSRKK